MMQNERPKEVKGEHWMRDKEKAVGGGFVEAPTQWFDNVNGGMHAKARTNTSHSAGSGTFGFILASLGPLARAIMRLSHV